MKRLVPAALAFVYFNALFTFENLPSTPAVRFVPRLSVEVLVLVIALAGARIAGLRLSRAARAILSLALFAAILVRYVDTTALGVLGRPFDLHGDFPHLHRVFAMFLDAMTPALGLLVSGTIVLLAAVAVALNGLALRALERALESAALRQGAILLAAAGVALFLVAPAPFGTTVSGIAARQLGNLRASGSLPGEEIQVPAATFDSDLGRLRGANVLVIFLESYGVALFDEPHHRDAIEPRFRELEASLREGGYFLSSSRIDSPTFGGGSWRAHATFLSGFHADSEHRYDALLASNRRTLVHLFKENGYRTVAAEPGIKWYWPDGLFYGFDRIYDFDALGYQGPAMGWWKIPDQYTLYRIYREEIRVAEKPLFAKVSLIMTHIPYYPVPEYVPDWTRFDDGTAYREGLHSVAHDAYRDLMELSRWYLEAVRYELDVLEGFLLRYVTEDTLVVILGDHQPPKLATHDDDSWSVPMHVLSRREELVRAFDELGFEEGLLPMRPRSLGMADFAECFLEIFDTSSTD